LTPAAAAVLALINAASALVAAFTFAGRAHTYPTSAFGGPRAVHVSRIGYIQIDLANDRGGLRRIPCAGLSRETRFCFVALNPTAVGR